MSRVYLMGNTVRSEQKRYVLLWGETSVDGSLLAQRLASNHYELRVFAELEPAMEFLTGEGRFLRLSAVLMPASKSARERLQFLKEFRQRAPKLFLKVPVLLVEPEAPRGRTVLAYKICGEDRFDSCEEELG